MQKYCNFTQPLSILRILIKQLSIKQMKRYIFLLLTVLISFTSCSLEEEDPITGSVPILLPIDSASVPSEFTYGESYSIVVNYSLPNGCYNFNDIHYETSNNSRTIAIRAILNDNQACTQSIVNRNHSFTLKCTQKETYILKFWKGKDISGQDQYLIVEVPVIVN